ncbi:MAG TPA: mechanosensitive ion channel family protein, partial [Deltaproteobacteria bacterium]|nr:mechanosensitive ion channel family protein [Deltaproteobacteria bacterium]
MNALKEIPGLFIQPTVTLTILVVILILIHLVLQRQFRGKPEKMLSRQLIMSGLTFVSAIVFIISLPVSDTVKGQILALIGIVLSAAIALSSTTFLGNAIAGIMLRAVRSFRV